MKKHTAKKAPKRQARKTARKRPSKPTSIGERTASPVAASNPCGSAAESIGETEYQMGFRHGKHRAESANPLLSARNQFQGLRSASADVNRQIRDHELILQELKAQSARIDESLRRCHNTIDKELYGFQGGPDTTFP